MKKLLASLALALLAITSFARADVPPRGGRLTPSAAAQKVEKFLGSSGSVVNVKVTPYVAKDGTSLYKGSIGPATPPGGVGSHFLRAVFGRVNRTTGAVFPRPSNG